MDGSACPAAAWAEARAAARHPVPVPSAQPLLALRPAARPLRPLLRPARPLTALVRVPRLLTTRSLRRWQPCGSLPPPISHSYTRQASEKWMKKACPRPPIGRRNILAVHVAHHRRLLIPGPAMFMTAPG